MKAIWLKGSVNISANYGFGDTPLEIFFAGVNTVCSYPTTKRLFNNGVSCKAFIPAISTWLQLDTSNAPGVEKIYYGPGRGVDIVVNAARNELTATPTNATRLVTMMEAAPPTSRKEFALTGACGGPCLRCNSCQKWGGVCLLCKYARFSVDGETTIMIP